MLLFIPTQVCLNSDQKNVFQIGARGCEMGNPIIITEFVDSVPKSFQTLSRNGGVTFTSVKRCEFTDRHVTYIYTKYSCALTCVPRYKSSRLPV